MKLGQKIAQLRKKSHLSQEALAQKMNVSRQAVSKWESNQSIPDIEKIVDLSELFGVSTDYLLKNGTPSFEVTNTSEDKKTKPNFATLKDEQIQRYLNSAKKTSHFQSLAAALCFLAIACFYLFLTFTLIYRSEIFETIGAISAIVLFASALGCLIHARLTMYEFKQIRQNKFSLLPNQQNNLANTSISFREKNNYRIVTGAVLCILAIIPPVALFFLSLPANWSWAIAAVSFVLLGIASYQFTFYFSEQFTLSTISRKRKRLSSDDKQTLRIGSSIFWGIILFLFFLLRHFIADIFLATSLSNQMILLAIIFYPVAVWIFFKNKAN